MPGAEAVESMGQKVENHQHQLEQSQMQNQVEPQATEPIEAETPFKSVDEAMAEIKRLRKENAERRTKGKALEERLNAMEGTFGKMKQAMGLKDETEVSPEEMIHNLQAEKQALIMELGLSEIANESGIPPEFQRYFKFLMAEKIQELETGESLDETVIDEIINSVRMIAGRKIDSSTGIQTSSMPNPQVSPGVTLEQFSKMNVGERSALFMKNQALYQSLMAEAVAKKLI